MAGVFVGVGLLLVAAQVWMIRPVNDRIGTEGSVRAGLVLNGTGLLLLSYSHDWALLVPSLALLTIGQALITPNLSSLVSGRVSAHHRGEALGFQQGVNAIGRVAGPAVAGVLYDRVSNGSPYRLGAALCAAALVVVVFDRRSIQR